MKDSNLKNIIINKINFKKYISSNEIEEEIIKLSMKLNKYYYGKRPTIIGILNGSIYFMMDLLKNIKFEYRIDFIKASSYKGTKSKKLSYDKILYEKFQGKDVLIVEDIIDTGKTMNNIYNDLLNCKPNDIKVISLLDKSYKQRQLTFSLDWIGFNIIDKYVIGYGMDYNNLFRYLKDIYIEDEK